MATTVRSGAGSSTELAVDPISLAVRMSLYNSLGIESNPAPTGAYVLPVNIRQTTAAATNTTVWAMRNGSSRTVYIRTVFLNTMFDGTAGSFVGRYGVQRFSTATPTGGTVINITRKKSTYFPSLIADARFLDTGLTTTSVVFETSMMVVGTPMSITSTATTAQAFFNYPNETNDPIVLGSGEGLCIRKIDEPAIIGLGIYGFVEWDER